MAKKRKLPKYPNGGQNPPIYTSDPNDPRLLAYIDSLTLYNDYLKADSSLSTISNVKRRDLGNSITYSLPYTIMDDTNTLIFYNHLRNNQSRNRLNFDHDYTLAGYGNSGHYTTFSLDKEQKPVQPVILNNNKYEADKRGLDRKKQIPTEVEKMTSNHINSTPINNTINPIPFEPNTYFTRERQGQELGQGKTDYFDKKTGKLLGTYENGGYFAMGGEINRYMVPAELPTGQEYFKLPFSELNAALANKQALYDKADTELSAIDKLFPEAGYRTQDRLQALKDKYIPQIESLRTQLGETGNVNPTKIREIASRLVQDPEYKTITQDFKYKEAVDKVMSTGNFKDYIQGFYDPNTGFNQTKPGEGFNGQWYGAIAPASWIDEYRQYTDFKPIKDNIEKSTGYQMRSFTNPETGESETWLFDGRKKEAVEKVTPELIKEHLTSDNKALLKSLYEQMGTPGKTFRTAQYQKDYNQPYDMEGAFFNDLMAASKFNQYNYTQTEVISSKVGELAKSKGAGSGTKSKISEPESIITSDWMSFNLPERFSSYSKQRDFLNNYVAENQKFLDDQENDLKITVAKELGLDPSNVNIDLSRGANNRVNSRISVNGKVLTPEEMVNINSVLKPYEQAITQELSLRESILKLHQDYGLVDASGKLIDGDLSKFMTKLYKSEQIYVYDQLYTRFVDPSFQKYSKYKEFQEAEKVDASGKLKDFKKAYDILKEYAQEKDPNFLRAVQNDAAYLSKKFLSENIDKASPKIKEFNQALENLKSAVIPSVSWMLPQYTTDDARANASFVRSAWTTLATSDVKPKFRIDDKEVSADDWKQLNKLMNITNDPESTKDDPVLAYIDKNPGFVTFRWDANDGMVMDLAIPGFTRADASKVNKNTQAQSSVISIPMTPSQQTAVKQKLGFSDQDQVFNDLIQMNLHFNGNENVPGNPLTPYKMGDLDVKLDIMNSRNLTNGQKASPSYKVYYKGINLSSGTSKLTNDPYKISLLNTILNDLKTQPEEVYSSSIEAKKRTLQEIFGFSPEVTEQILTKARQ